MSLSEFVNGDSRVENQNLGTFRRLKSLFQKYITVKNIKRTLVYIFATSCLLLTLLTWSSLIYTIIYRMYVPQMKHTFPLYFQFLTAENPEAIIMLNTPCMRNGVKYDIVLDLKIPDIPDLPEKVGNFMIKLDVYAEKNQKRILKFSTSRPSHLKFQSKLIKVLLKVIKMGPLMVGWIEETIYHRIFLAESINDPIQQSAGYISLILTSKCELPIYEAKLLIIAHLTGLRYFMYFWFFTTAFIGIIFLTFAQAIACICIFILAFPKIFATQKQTSKSNSSMEILDTPDDNDIIVPDIGWASSSIRKRIVSTEIPEPSSVKEEDASNHDKRD